MLLTIYPDNINDRHIKSCVDALKKGEVIVIPTDGVYAFACDLNNQNAVEKLCRIKKLDPAKASLSVLFNDFSHLSEFTNQINNVTFRLLKKTLPGPFTFILEANQNVPKIFKQKKKTIGIRIPDNKITQELIKAFGGPLVAGSVTQEDDILQYISEPEQIEEHFHQQVAYVIDGGVGLLEGSTIVDCTGSEPVLIRQGVGILPE